MKPERDPGREEARSPDPASDPDESDRLQLLERLRWTPKQRLDYLVDMIAFEERAHRARKL